ncbi:MAG: TatD family hydrolase [Candidatus Gastranaerophilales bacterium]|nr:TatD family hydrolase [Candidatus Gastranaerophilales bacterium]
MSTFIDTHAHLDFDEFKDSMPDLIEELKKNGIKKVILPGVNKDNSRRIIELTEKYDMFYGALGVHPSEAKTWDGTSYEYFKNLAQHEKIVAVGEIGLDYYWDKTFNDVQKHVFREQIRLAKELKKPVIVHDREAHLDTFNILKETNAAQVGVVMHCFSGSSEFALQCVKEGFYIAIGGPVTFKNALKPKEVAKNIDINYLLLETDSPYLAPHPYRGSVNSPMYIPIIASVIAELRGISLDEVAETTTRNANKLFNLDKK